MNKELKSCPFCGGEPYTAIGKDAQFITFKVACYNCCIKREIAIQAGANFENVQSAINEVIELWNGRAE